MARTKIKILERTDLTSLSEAVRSGRVDREKGVIREVKLMGFDSLNGRRYRQPDPKLFEGVKIRIDHANREGEENPVDPSFTDSWAVARNVKVTEQGVYADVRFNPKHEMIESILWWAENEPHIGGFSPVSWGWKSEENGETIIDIVYVESVDLVDRPATTNGFYEEMKMDPEKMKAMQEEIDALKAKAATADALQAQVESLKAEKAKSDEALAVAQEALTAAKVLEERKTLLTGLEVSEQFKEAVLKAGSKEAAVAMVEALKAEIAKPRSGASTPGDVSGGKSQSQVVESLDAAKKAGLLSY